MFTQTNITGSLAFIGLLSTVYNFASFFIKRDAVKNEEIQKVKRQFIAGWVFGTITICLLGSFLLSIFTLHMWLIFLIALSAVLIVVFSALRHVASENNPSSSAKTSEQLIYGWIICGSAVGCFVFICLYHYN
jgi:ABC-type protease/lipase transport system fused ATPase/permease subunit